MLSYNHKKCTIDIGGGNDHSPWNDRNKKKGMGR